MSRNVMRLRTLFLLCLLVVGATTPAAAQTGPERGFAFMQVEPAARAAALGGSMSSICCDDLGAFFHNPALLSPAVDGVLTASYLNHLSDLSAGFVAYARDLGRYGTAGAGLRFLHYGQFDRADESGERQGTFSASDLVFTVGIGRDYRAGLRYGANLHFVYSGIDTYQASALLADVGVAYHLPERQFTASASLNSAGIVLQSLGRVADKVPMDLRISASKGLRHVPILVTFTAYDLLGLGTSLEEEAVGHAIAAHALLGLEFRVISALTLRFGYSHRRHQSLSSGSRLDIAGAGMGFGLRVRQFTLDYAFSSWSFAGLHQVTFGARL